ncbi:hypothetical protein QBC35DRAFT_440674 [Podospora australis]|uniref:Uncharacterized protein n=1 Tax=Podospora australis TaxID=1536484 RepID=A0AAN6WMS5_9PEZI|nr:hypothetical protein QBC35DRAFT_440674 [Podospora australis]
MERIQDAAESRRIVRTYSADVMERLPPGHPSHFLGRVLHDQHLQDEPETSMSPWHKFFEPSLIPAKDDPITGVIAIEANKLRDKWLKFQQNCAKEDQLDLQAFEPTLESVFDIVTDMNLVVQTKRKAGVDGKITSKFHKFCEKLDSHGELLKILPEGNEYVSIFAGSLNAIIKASANHERVAEVLAESLCAISENVAECQAELEIFRTPTMLEKVADLYAHIFVFLSTYMDWMMRKRARRLLDSFNENFAREFELDIKKINDKSTMIRNLVAQSSRAEVRVTRLHVEDIKRDIRVGREGDARHRAEMEYFAAAIERELMIARQERRELQEGGRQVKELTAQLTRLLQEPAMAWIMDRGASPGRISPLYPGSIFMSQTPSIQSTAEEVSINSAHLEDHFQRDRVRLPCGHLGPFQAPRLVIQRLAVWTYGGTGTNVLWIEGPPNHSDDLDNPVTVLAAQFTEMAALTKLPIISYFCELRRGDRLRGDNSPEQQALLSLASSILRQMIELLLPLFETDVDFSVARFSRLDGSADSWDEAKRLFNDLLPLMPDAGKIFCIIDGLHWLEDRSTDELLTDFVEVMRRSRMKVLFTTSGRAPSLRESVSAEDTLVVDTFDLVHDHQGVDGDDLLVP